jgi:integration host factor subunit beta
MRLMGTVRFAISDVQRGGCSSHTSSLRTVVKSKLVHALSEKLPELQVRDVELALNCVLNQMVDALILGERIEIRGFGAFAMRHRPPRLARNPRIGEAVNLPAKVAVHFKPGKEMRDRVDAARDQCGITESGLNQITSIL